MFEPQRPTDPERPRHAPYGLDPVEDGEVRRVSGDRDGGDGDSGDHNGRADDPWAPDWVALRPDRLDPPLASHGALTEVDPWAPPPRSAGEILWPWGLRGLTETLEVIALALIMFMGVRMMVHNYVVDGGSMVPTFENGQLVIVNRLAYQSFDVSWVPGVSNSEWRPFGELAHGDVIVFTFTQNRPRDFIKRVVALPGDTVEVRDGVLLLNGVPLDEPYIAALANNAYGPEVVPPGHLFVMGDNRNNSYDSRLFGMVEDSTVIGRAEVRYWPLHQVTLIDHGLGAPRISAEVEPSSSTAR